jgi:hypothetical protein
MMNKRYIFIIVGALTMVTTQAMDRAAEASARPNKPRRSILVGLRSDGHNRNPDAERPYPLSARWRLMSTDGIDGGIGGKVSTLPNDPIGWYTDRLHAAARAASTGSLSSQSSSSLTSPNSSMTRSRSFPFSADTSGRSTPKLDAEELCLRLIEIQTQPRISSPLARAHADKSDFAALVRESVVLTTPAELADE